MHFFTLFVAPLIHGQHDRLYLNAIMIKGS